MKNSKSGAVRTSINQEPSPLVPKKVNDKNVEVKSVEVDAVMVEKKKTYEFGTKEPAENEIIMSDEFLGSKVKVQKLTIMANK